MENGTLSRFPADLPEIPSAENWRLSAALALLEVFPFGQWERLVGAINRYRDTCATYQTVREKGDGQVVREVLERALGDMGHVVEAFEQWNPEQQRGLDAADGLGGEIGVARIRIDVIVRKVRSAGRSRGLDVGDAAETGPARGRGAGRLFSIKEEPDEYLGASSPTPTESTGTSIECGSGRESTRFDSNWAVLESIVHADARARTLGTVGLVPLSEVADLPTERQWKRAVSSRPAWLSRLLGPKYPDHFSRGVGKALKGYEEAVLEYELTKAAYLDYLNQKDQYLKHEKQTESQVGRHEAGLQRAVVDAKLAASQEQWRESCRAIHRQLGWVGFAIGALPSQAVRQCAAEILRAAMEKSAVSLFANLPHSRIRQSSSVSVLSDEEAYQVLTTGRSPSRPQHRVEHSPEVSDVPDSPPRRKGRELPVDTRDAGVTVFSSRRPGGKRLL
jgi:hypothetical protein